MSAAFMKNLFLGASTLILLSCGAIAQDKAEVKASEQVPACGGLMQPGGDTIDMSYKAAPAAITWDSEPVYIGGPTGTMTADGKVYKLHHIELTADSAYPISAVYYHLTLRFVHQADDGSTILLSVPVKEGASNPAFESMVSQPQDAYIDPNDLLPRDRRYGTLPPCADDTFKHHFLLLSPIEGSPAQIERLKQPA